MSAILNTKIVFFGKPAFGGLSKTDFGISCAEGAGNTKIGFIMRIAIYCHLLPFIYME
ncbi:hypothetical protein VB774_13485 [Pseudanabaena galeata UHCC 0370]|uniref:Uncharacterized protein n=1 Tax=Pseudanabaena galeata UHCC 0370 TaxID=3110310 RepID=A0ABU5TKA8_9CYAN|nr:hypothetical protein [Pseudanabaena galeata UHCC 0370]